MRKHFLEATTPKHHCEIVKILVVSCHENLVELIFVVWNLSSGLKLPEFRASICLNRSGRAQKIGMKKKMVCFFAGQIGPSLNKLSMEALLPKCWKVSWLDSLTTSFAISPSPTALRPLILPRYRWCIHKDLDPDSPMEVEKNCPE